MSDQEDDPHEDQVAEQPQGGDGDDGESKADERLVWFERRITAALKVKPDRIKNLVRGDNFSKQVSRFCDGTSSHVHVFEKDSGELDIASDVQHKLKKKSIVFYKRGNDSLGSYSDLNAHVCCSELGQNTAQVMLAVSKSVFLPVLSSKEFQEGWSEVMRKELSDNMNSFVANTYVVIGEMGGRTLLPLPPDNTYANLDKSSHDKESVHILESSIISWTAQIKEVLVKDPEQRMLEGLHPGPDEELEFWSSKAKNMNSVHVQLTSAKVAKVVKVLELTKSTYFPAFHRLCKEVKDAADEANDNTMHLKTLEPYLQQIKSEDFASLHTVYRPMMHTMLLIWKHSKFYNTSTRMVVLVREICNDIIKRSQEFVNDAKIFEIDPAESVDVLKECLRVCIAFKSVLFDYKTRATVESPKHPWKFKNSALFPRMDAFLERCHDILDLMQTIVQFSKLDRVEIGGTKGKALTSNVQQIFADFSQALTPFQVPEYDLVGVENKAFDEDFYNFRAVIQDLERRIASVIIQAFDDSTTIMGCFKLLDAFDNLLERNVITSDLSKKHTDLMEAFADDLKMVQDLFVKGSANPPVESNWPPRAGAVVWVRGLMARLDEPVARFRSMGHGVVESEEGEEAMRAYEAILRSMTEFERRQVQEWSQELEHTSQDKLKQNLLRREAGDEGHLRVNFDPALVCLLREVKYFKLLNDWKSSSQDLIQIPESAIEIYAKAEVFRQQTGNLELIVNIYNNMLATLVEVERPLVQSKLDSIDKVLLKGLKHMNWKSQAISDFIAQTMAIVRDANSVLQTCKANVKETQTLLQSFANNLMMDRKPIKTYTMEEYQEVFHTLLMTRYAAIEKGSLEMQSHLDSSLKVLKVNKSSPAWRTYVDYFNQIVIDGIVNAICASMKYLKNQVDPAFLNQHDVNPLLEIQLRLAPPDVVYEPMMGSTSHGVGMRDILNTWLNSFINAATLVNRLDTHDYDGDYLADIQEDLSVRNATAQVSRLFAWTEQHCEQFRQCFLEYSYLWTTDIEAYFQNFLIENADTSPDALDSDPPLAMFDAEIHKYKHLVDEIHDLPASKVIGSLKVDAKPVKNALSSVISKWVHQFQNHLLQKLTKNVTGLSEFIDVTDRALDTDVTDQDSMLEVMGYLRDVRKRTEGTDRMFDPLRSIVTMLGKHSVGVPGEIVAGLEQVPEAWANVKKKALVTKEKHSKEQNAQAEKVKRQSKDFEFRVEEFFGAFKRNMPWEYSANYEMAYQTMDRIHHGPKSEDQLHGSLVEIKADSIRLNEMQELFELFVVEYRQVDQCLKEARLLKAVWDMISHVTIQFTEWRKTKWDEIDVETLQDKAKELAKEIKTVDKSVKNWPAYKGLEDAVKNMQVSLPLVQELHHPAMRERHWKQLMRTTSVSFQMGPNFSLGQLLDLQLHQFEDDVLEIVDRAQKELTIEKQLRKLADVWDSLELQFPPEPENPGLFLISVDEALMEALEDNSMQLQNLMGSKYVQGNQSFLDQVQGWQRRLGMVDVTLNAWKEVQSKWSNLQSIFVGSADIRVQLPEESKRFEATDADWKEMMKDAPSQPNALLACNLEGRLEKIEAMLASLEKCEKALADYLETKRAAYPRFYFVAAADLLDILSKGSNPQLILKHLPKCFDNIKTLEFDKEASGEPTRSSIGMYSGEGEYVQWVDNFVCEGAVEVWLDGLTHHTHQQLQNLLHEAVEVFDEKPRHGFIFDWCAEIASVVCRIVYTEDVNFAFDALEEGNENSMKDYNAKQIDILNKYAELILGELSGNDRKKIIMLVTLDVHARDVVMGLIDSKAENNQTFAWMSQLKYHMEDKSQLARIEICDYVCYFGYEYIGNCGCLVVTPLTDRCYITLTQAMRLCLGGAPAGPAGTGKTETTKDLGRALGIMVYVFNCSDQMDYRSMGQIFKGLSQAGAWGCFDEFNRIDISVLSVVSTQWKCILDAIRGKRTRFTFEDEDIILNHSPFCSAYITMNPGYAGRTELPESVKALFRPCAMIVPDMDLICEIMLMSEGYSDGKVLARKFMILYRLSESLLSAQKHYDWKLRAVKTTLNVAGGMLRADRESSEDRVLLRALRDFNMGKLVADDVNIFLGMIDDLFPKQREHVVRAREFEFEEVIVKAANEANLQSGEVFVLKVSQLREILAVRWSVFVIGPAGCGKTELIRVLSKAENLFGEKSTINVLNPKSVTRNELYGYIHPSTREWKDGLLSQIFRDLANCFTVKHEYLLLDGDIDAEWIESMNTVMDDNKTLTLASNERIPLTPPMRLLLEIENMSQASPATVSRGGVIFMNGTDVGWKPYVDSWIQNREIEGERIQMTSLFAKYIPKVFDFMEKNCATIVPIPEISRVQHLTYILEGLIGNGEEFNQKAKQMGHDRGALLLEMYFMYASLWSCGGALLSDKRDDQRAAFEKWFRGEFADPCKFPEDGLPTDYYVEETTLKFENWSDRTSNFVYDPELVYGNIYVSTLETERLSYLTELLISKQRAVMLVGGAGTGKTTLMKDKLRNLDADQYGFLNVNLNCFTDSMLLQTAMESVLEKKTGRTFGPPGTKRQIYFIDDLNMPEVDKYGTQQPIALLRQIFDYGGWYSRDKLTWREISNVQVVSCLNPTAGSFFIDKRLQRSYCTYALAMPSAENLEYVFSAILSGHLESFNPDVGKVAPKIVKAAADLQRTIVDNFMPTAIRFHYVFNLRDMGNIFEGLLRCKSQFFTSPLPIVRLWLHESERVYCDRLISEGDQAKFFEILEPIAKKWFEELKQEQLFATPNIFTTFTHEGEEEEDRPYTAVPDMPKLSKLMQERLDEYNESNAVMDLVLFDTAVEHVCRCTRIIDKPRGNALMVGVGGSGKQSLARLSSFICGCETFQITVTATYGVNDFKENLLYLYQRAGVKGIKTCFVMNDGQIVNERFLVFINDFLASGNIPDVLTNESKDEFRNSVRNEAKQAGVQDTPDNLLDFFIEKTRKNLHLILTFSPVGDKFRVRSRQFPALINCTTLDYFHPWPQEALEAVAKRFVTGTDGIPSEQYETLGQHMAFMHTSVNEASEDFLSSQRRYNYTTPKSFLDLIDLYKSMLQQKKEGLRILKERLENGLEKMQSAADQVAELQENLVKDMAIVEQKKAATDKLLEFVGQETAGADEQKANALVEEEKCSEIKEGVSKFQLECEKEMEAAEPVIAAAIDALNSLDKKSLTELKALSSPPAGVDDVTAGVMVILGGGKIPKDLSWGAAKKLMANVDAFLKALQDFDKDNTPVVACEWVEKNLFTQEKFNPEAMKSKSAAAAGMCAWVINIIKYYRIYEVVEPKRQLLAEANVKLDEANTKLTQVRADVAALEAKLAELSQQFEEATAEKNEAVAQAEKTQMRASMADRLVNGLADEKVRWSKAVESFGVQEAQFVGDVLLASAFVSYVGAFNLQLRGSLVSEKWIPDMSSRKIPMTDGMHPLEMLSDDATIATWGNEGLPADTMSIQNGAIVCSCKRWPLLIDPQLQGIKWIKAKHVTMVYQAKPEDAEDTWEAPPPTVKEMMSVQMTQSKYLNHVEMAIQNGEAIVIENLGEALDAVLEPVLMRAVTKRGRSMVMKLGDKEVEFDPKFKLYLQTKLSNPHYKPEIAAQTTLINFMITVDGLQEQLLALVVNKERPDLEEQKSMLMEQQNGFKVKLKELEDELLYRLATSQGDILADVELIEGLESAKITSNDINAKAAVAKETEAAIVESRKAYVPVATRAALLYFLIDQMWALDHMYRFSMASFVTIFIKGMDRADSPGGGATAAPPITQTASDDHVDEAGAGAGAGAGADAAAQAAQPPAAPATGQSIGVPPTEMTVGAAGQDALNARVALLTDTSSTSCFNFVAQALFERHKLIFACQLCFRTLAMSGEIPADLFDYLLRGTVEAGSDNPCSEWMDDKSWGGVQAIKQFEVFEKLSDDLLSNPKRFREWYELERPEDAPLPGEWKKLGEFQKIVVVRALRPDRMSEALSIFVKAMLGAKYVESKPFNLKESFGDSSPYTPVFFILSPGVDPVRDTELLAKEYQIGFDLGNFSLVSLGQGQEPVAEKAVDTGALNGNWAFLQNIHLTPKWTSGWLEKRVEDLENSHSDFRLFLSAEPAKLPVNLLQVCVKLTNEPPEGLKPNLIKNFSAFTDDFFDTSAKPGELRGICFALALFHSIILERKKFGPQGWNRSYPFNKGDLVSCAQVALNNLETNPKVPWDDLKYIFGEIMYGGHITDAFDRRLAGAYLDTYMLDELFEGFEIFPGFHAPNQAQNVKDVIEAIETTMPQETPVAFGLHNNAEIGFRMKQADEMFLSIRELQPRSGGGIVGMSVTERAKTLLDELVEKMPDAFDFAEVVERVEERSPYVNVFLQEIERSIELMKELARSLAELDLGLKGDLQMSERMEVLQLALAENRVPSTWEALAYPSKRPLGMWFLNFIERHRQLSDWTAELGLPKLTWISGLFNPQSFLTAIMQTSARKNDWPLDKMVVQTEVTKKLPEEIQSVSKDGAYVHGMTLEGARWDDKSGMLDDSLHKELFAKMPVTLIRAVTVEKEEKKDTYPCPVYMTQDRGHTYIFTAGLKSKGSAAKWTMAGVAIILDVV